MRRIPDRLSHITSLTYYERRKGVIDIIIPPQKEMESVNGEKTTAWVAPADYPKVFDQNCKGRIKAILLQKPVTYNQILFKGAEVMLRCHGGRKPTLDPDWVKKNILLNE